MKKIDCILLVDDHPTTNFLNEELIEDMGIAEKTVVAWNGQEALDYITNKKNIKPNIIFIDINMPVMGGFEFLSEFKKLSSTKRKGIDIVFLTTSDAQIDRQKIAQEKLVTAFLEKPLRKKKLLDILLPLL